MRETSTVATLRVSTYRWLPALGIAYAAMSSFGNAQMLLSRSALLGLVALASMLLLPAKLLPRPRPGLRIASLTLFAIFACGILRVIALRPFDIASVSMISSVLGMTACWYLGTATAVVARRPERTLEFFACILPLAGVTLLLIAFSRGVLPQTNYWQFVRQVATGDSTARTPFALSEDALSLLVFFVGVAPFSFTLREWWLRWGALLGGSAALALLILNGSMTFVVAALAACAATAVFGSKSLRREERRRAVVPFLTALLLGSGGAGYAMLVKPEFAAPIVASLGNKNVLQGHSLLDGRDEFWGGAITHLADSPLVGYPLDEATTEETRYTYGNPHNDFLLAALKFGVPAALLLLFAVLWVAWDLAAGMRHPPSDVGRSAAIVGFAAWTALWLPPLYAGWLSSPFFSNLALAGIAGLSYALLRLHSPRGQAESPASPLPRAATSPVVPS